MEPAVEDEEYNLDEIFPTYKLDFDNVTKIMKKDYTRVCFSIIKQLHNDGDTKFIKPCQKLIHYLEHIKEESRAGIHLQSCKYFSYILKNELQEVPHSCKGTKECYNIIIKELSSEFKGIDVCKDHIKEINEKIFKKFQKLDNLYDIFYKFMNTQEVDNTKCPLGRECSQKYIDHITLCHPISHIGFCKALNKFKETYNMYMENGPKCENVPKYLYSPFGNDKRPIFFIILITIFAMSIIMFTVYKFTPVYSWIHSKLRRKSKIRNDLYEESLDLKNNANIKKNNSKNSPLNIQYYSLENS